jgi:hypothetical protein
VFCRDGRRLAGAPPMNHHRDYFQALVWWHFDDFDLAAILRVDAKEFAARVDLRKLTG